MTDDNIIKFDFTKNFGKKIEKVNYSQYSHLSEADDHFSYALENTKPSDSATGENWMVNWLDAALNDIPAESARQISNERALLQLMMLTRTPVRRMMIARLWLSQGRTNVVVNSGKGQKDIVDYPSPLVSYLFGRGCRITTQYYIFDNELSPEAVQAASAKHEKSPKLSFSSYLREDLGVNKLYLFEPELIQAVYRQFRKEALAAQRGYEIAVYESTLVLRFSQPASDHSVIGWMMSIDKTIYDVELI